MGVLGVLSARRRTHRQTDRLRDANRFYNLSHAICYSYGTDNNKCDSNGQQIQCDVSLNAIVYCQNTSGVTRGQGAGGADRPGWHLPGGWHQKKHVFVAEFTKNSGQTRSDRLKKMRGDTLQGWHPSEINKSDSDEQKKVARFFRKK